MEVHPDPLVGSTSPPTEGFDGDLPRGVPIDLCHTHLSQKHESDAPPSAEAPAERTDAARLPKTNVAATQASERADEMSIPPVDLDTSFFEAPPQRSPDGSLESEVRDPRVSLKATPFAAKRRAHLARYVTLAVGLSSALCLAALVKGTMARGDEGAPSPFAAQAMQVVAPAVPPVAADPAALLNAPATTATAASPPIEANSVQAGTDPKAPAAPPQSPTAAVLPAPQPGTAAPAAPQPDMSSQPVSLTQPTAASAQAAMDPTAVEHAKPVPGSAIREKQAAQAALERGRLVDAVAAGSRSVALDPTDAEAWLILGAAHQARGAQREANQTFKSCIELAKRGPKGECAALIR